MRKISYILSAVVLCGLLSFFIWNFNQPTEGISLQPPADQNATNSASETISPAISDKIAGEITFSEAIQTTGSEENLSSSESSEVETSHAQEISKPVSTSDSKAFALALEKVSRARDLHTDDIMEIPGVVGVGDGLGSDGNPAIVVLTETAEVAGLPSTLDGVPVEARVTGRIDAFPAEADGAENRRGGGSSIDPKGRFARPVPIGVSTGNEGECSAGTIGVRVTDGASVYALSNNHVYALENDAAAGSNVLQPGRYDTACTITSSDVIGTLFSFVPLDFTGGDNRVDAAMALTDAGSVGKATPTNGYGLPKSATVSPVLGATVQKYGRTTGLTKSTITGINYTINVGYSNGTARFTGQIIAQSSGKAVVLKAGDSGSLLVTNPGRNPVGLLFAGNNTGKLGVANSIDEVLAALGVTVDGE